MKSLLILSALTTLLLSDSYKIECARPASNNKSDIAMYKGCIDEYIQKHKEQRALHTNAVNQAIKDWNDFVNGVNNSTSKDNQSRKFKASHSSRPDDPYKLSTGFKF